MQPIALRFGRTFQVAGDLTAAHREADEHDVGEVEVLEQLCSDRGEGVVS